MSREVARVGASDRAGAGAGAGAGPREAQRSRLASPWVVALALFGFAVSLRAVAASRIAAMFNDGPHFILMARLMGEGRWADALSHPYHPAYPVTILLAWPVTGDWERAGVAASVTAGGLAVVALYAFLRSAFGPTPAWIGALLLALHPYVAVFSADVQSEGLYLACFLGAAACAWRGHVTGHPALAFAAGACSGLAYLTRPEGLGVALAALGLAAISWLAGRTPFAVAARYVVAVSLGLALFVVPYVSSIHENTGEWTLTRKKSIGNLISTETYSPVVLGVRGEREGEHEAPPPVDPPPLLEALEPIAPPAPAPRVGPAAPEPRGAARLAWASAELAITSLSALRPEYLLLTLLGLYACRGRPGDRGVFVLALLALYGVVLFGLTFNVGYLSRRHVLPPLIPLLGYAAVGLPLLGGVIASGVARVTRRPKLPAPALSIALGLALVGGIALPKLVKPRRLDRVAERRAAEWLGDHAQLRGPVAAEGARTAYYAGERFVPLYAGSGNTFARARSQGARFVVVDEDRVDVLGGLRPALGHELRLIHRQQTPDDSAVVLQVLGTRQNTD